MESPDNNRDFEDPLYDALLAARRSMHVPDLADAWLAILAEDGSLSDESAISITSNGKPLTRPILEDPVNTPSDPSVYPARLDNGQVIWVRLDKRRSTDAPVSAHVVDKPDSVVAVLAALTIMEGDAVDIEQVRKHLPLIDLSHPNGISESVYEVSLNLASTGDKALALELARNFPVEPARYALALLRYYRPGFDTLSEDEKRKLLIGCCERMNRTIAAVRQLTGFLEYGVPSRDQRPAIENPQRDVEATIMRDVEEATYREIAAHLSVEVSKSARNIGDYSTIQKMVGRGRDILERAFGDAGWHAIAVAAKQERSRRNALTWHEKFLDDSAEDWRISSRAAEELIAGRRSPSAEESAKMKRAVWSLEERRHFFEIVSINGKPLKDC